MAARRNKYKANFKAQVALEALTGEKTNQARAHAHRAWLPMGADTDLQGSSGDDYRMETSAGKGISIYLRENP
jgi:hypothetical protein